MEIGSSSRTRTRSQCPSLASLPFFALEIILSKLGSSSSPDVMKCKCVCKTLREVAEFDTVYKHLELDTLTQDRFEKRTRTIVARCKAVGNLHIKFKEGMTCFIKFGNTEAGRQKLEDAANLGQVDARFVLGMLLMAQGPHRKEEALALLNGIEEYRHSWKTRILQRTLNRVNHELFARKRPEVEINDCLLTCTTHRHIDRAVLRRAFHAGYHWIFECPVCLWDHCYARFASHFADQCDWLFD